VQDAIAGCYPEKTSNPNYFPAGAAVLCGMPLAAFFILRYCWGNFLLQDKKS